LFEPFGALKRCGIIWDNLGRSKGNGVIEFIDRADAEKAMQELEGKEVMDQAISVKFSSGRESS
jgi:RNA recognition motif-containing protein